MTGPYFETWSHENLAKFAKDTYARLQEQEKGVQEFEIYRLGYKQGASDERLMCADLFEQMTLAGYPQAIVIAAIRARGEKK